MFRPGLLEIEKKQKTTQLIYICRRPTRSRVLQQRKYMRFSVIGSHIRQRGHRPFHVPQSPPLLFAYGGRTRTKMYYGRQKATSNSEGLLIRWQRRKSVLSRVSLMENMCYYKSVYMTVFSKPGGHISRDKYAWTKWPQERQLEKERN